MKVVVTILFTFCSFVLMGQNSIKIALEYWEKGNFEKVQKCIKQILQISPENDTALILKAKVLFVHGKYPETINICNNQILLSKYPEVVDLTINAFLHLYDYENAVRIANTYRSGRVKYLEELREKPFKILADTIYYIPFVQDSVNSSNFIPLSKMFLNGIKKNVMFDTGADFLIIGENVANELGVKYSNQSIGEHATSKVTIWHTIIDSLSFEHGPAFYNVPTTIMGGSPDLMIWGTNILEPFLSTIDYPDQQFILTPRNNNELCQEHYRVLSSQQHYSIPFYMWSDHYMFAKGYFSTDDSLNFFFDSGLIAIGNFNGELKQASFTASKESMLKWGYKSEELVENTFFQTNESLGVDGLNQPNTLLWFDKNLVKDRNFGGIRIDGLISHAWLRNYSWTIDFDKMEYTFRID